VLFTCDEEIGRGVRHVDVAKLAAAACYTLDGQGADEIDVETFSANLAVVKVHGVNIHPSIAKGRMVNAARAAAAYIDRLPRTTLAPEVTDDREGFLHPYAIAGGVAEATLRILMRDFDSAALEEQASLLRQRAAEVEQEFPGVRIEVAITPQYRNMADGLRSDPRAVDYAIEAHRRLGREPKMTIVRGGTDGSQLTERGLPTPNLSTGQHNLHSPLEWACLEEMVQAAQVLVELAMLWAEDSQAR
jgi:tripeptide aminopeptidase